MRGIAEARATMVMMPHGLSDKVPARTVIRAGHRPNHSLCPLNQHILIKSVTNFGEIIYKFPDMKIWRIALIILVISMISCGGAKAPADTLVVAIQSNPTTFDPRLAVDAYSMKINQLIYNGLLKLDDNFSFVPDLAERYEQLDDLTFRFYLKKGVLFQSGYPLTADDVVYTYQSVLNGTVPSPHRTVFGYIEEIKKEGDDVIYVRLREPYAPFLLVMTKGIVSKKQAELLGPDYGHNPIGTGPYKLIEFDSDAKVVLKANDKYFGEKPKLPFLKFVVLKDDNVRVLQLMRGSVDLIQNATPPVLLSMLSKRKDLDVDSDLSIIFSYLGMNLEDPILSKVLVRKALAHSINKEEIVKYKWEGYARVANTLLTPLHWAYSDEVTVYDFDPAEAKRLLDEAGYPDPDGDGPEKRFYLSYKTSTQKHRIDIANLIAKQLEKVGIGVTVTPYEWGTFFRDVKIGNFQLYSLAWVGITDPDIYYNIYHSEEFPPKGANRNRYKNEEIDRLVELGRTTMDQDQRREIYKRVQQIVADELPYIPLWYEDNVVVRRNIVVGYKITPNASFRSVVYVTKE